MPVVTVVDHFCTSFLNSHATFLIKPTARKRAVQVGREHGHSGHGQNRGREQSQPEARYNEIRASHVLLFNARPYELLSVSSTQMRLYQMLSRWYDYVYNCVSLSSLVVAVGLNVGPKKKVSLKDGPKRTISVQLPPEV